MAIDLEQFPVGALPPILFDIARWTSPEVAIAIAKQLGGRRMYIPKGRLKRDHPLVKAVGWKTALLIADRLAGETIVWSRAAVAIRCYEARRLRAEGLSIMEISRRLDLVPSSVKKWITAVMPGEGCDAEPASIPEGPCPVCGHRHRPRAPHRGDPRQLSLWPNAAPEI